MGPINYAIDVQSPVETALQGYQMGAGIRQVQDERAAAQAKVQQQQLMQQDLAAASRDPRQLPALMVKYPQLSESLKRGWDVMSSEQQTNNLNHVTEVYSALQSGRPDIAKQVLSTRAEALRNSGDEQGAKTVDDMVKWAEQHPESLTTSIALRLAAIPGGDKVIDKVATLGQEGRAAAKAPAELKKAEADAAKAGSDATKAAVDAKYADQVAVQDLAKKGWDIKKITADIEIAREANRIAAMNAASTQATNDLRRQELELKVKESRAALDEKIRDRVATVESAATTIDNFLNTADRILASGTEKVKRNGKDVVIPNSTLRAATGPLDSRLPTVQTDVANIEALVETLGSQAFLSQIPALKGMGQLSDAEGKKVQAALTNLSLSQGADQLVANVKEAQRLILKARKNIETRHGVPAGVPDTPAVQTSEADIDALVDKYTRPTPVRR